MIRLSDCSKFATDPRYSEARGTCCGLAIFFATLLALGTIAALSASLELHTLFMQQAQPAYAHVSAGSGM